MPAESPKPTAAFANPCIEITPTPKQYERLCLDLRKLRERGATSNTDAILAAVRDAAARRKMPGDKAKAGRRGNAPGTAPGGSPDARAA